MVKTILKIDGMACAMCESHINDAVRNACNVRSLTLSLMTDRQDAGAHCNVGNTKLALDTMADWIIRTKAV